MCLYPRLYGTTINCNLAPTALLVLLAFDWHNLAHEHIIIIPKLLHNVNSELILLCAAKPLNERVRLCVNKFSNGFKVL